MTDVKSLLNKEIVYTSIMVKDIEKAKKFYQDIFQFEVKFDGGNEIGWVELALPVEGARLGLSLAGDREIKHGSSMLVLTVNNLDDMKAYLEKKDVTTTEITDMPDMVSYFNMHDPDGNIIQLVSDPRVTTK